MKLLKTALVCTIAALAIPAQAATVTLDLTDDAPGFSDSFVNNGDTVSAGDFSLTFGNVVLADGPAPGPVLDKGIFFSSLAFFDLSAEVVFNIDTIIETYDVGLASLDSFFFGFQLSGPNGTSGLNSFRSAGTNAFDMGTIPVFLAGETYTLTHTVDRSVATLSALGLTKPPAPAVVPLPASLPLLLAGFGALAALWRRR